MGNLQLKFVLPSLWINLTWMMMMTLKDYSDEEDTSQDDSHDDFDLTELDDDTNEVLLDNFMASTAQGGKTRGVDPKHLSKIWRISHEDAQRTIDVSTKCPLEQMIQPYPGTTQPMIGSSGTLGSRTFSSWRPSLQPRNVANHHEVILVVNFLSLINDSFMVFQ